MLALSRAFSADPPPLSCWQVARRSMMAGCGSSEVGTNATCLSPKPPLGFEKGSASVIHFRLSRRIRRAERREPQLAEVLARGAAADGGAAVLQRRLGQRRREGVGAPAGARPLGPAQLCDSSSLSLRLSKNERSRIVLTKRTRLCPDHDVAVFDGELWVLGGCYTEAQGPEEVGVDGNQSESRPK